MLYNLDLEQKLDRLAGRFGKFDKKKMFGGIGYLMNGNMVFGIHKESLVIRTSPERAEELLKRDSVRVFDLTGRPMKGWLLISPGSLVTDNQLSDLLDLSVDFVRTLPKK